MELKKEDGNGLQFHASLEGQLCPPAAVVRGLVRGPRVPITGMVTVFVSQI